MATDGVHRAIVSDVSDPEERGRVKLKPARGVRGGAWAAVTTVALPQVDDEVLVAFEEGDLGRPVVIGMLWGDELALRFGPSSVVLGADGVVRIDDASGNAVTLSTTGITITASAKVRVSASQVDVSAGMVRVDAGMTKFSGAVQCDTLITNSVVAQSYTPGVGNIA